MSTSTDFDLRALRPSTATVDAEFGPDRRAALLATIVATPTEPGRPVTRPLARRRVLLVAAGVAVLAAGGGVLSDLPSRLPGSRLLPVTAQPAAADTLDELAARAGRQPATPPLAPGQYRAVVSVDQQTGAAPITHEAYVAADGWTWRRDTENLDHTWFLYPAAEELDPASLPTDPVALERVLRRRWLGTESDDAGLFKVIGELALTQSAPPGVRAASIRVLTAMAERPVRTVPGRKDGPTAPDVSVATGVLAGRPVVGATFVDTVRPGRRQTYWFDRDTSELLRTDSVFPDGTTASTQIRSRRVVDALPGDVVRRLGTERVERIVK